MLQANIEPRIKPPTNVRAHSGNMDLSTVFFNRLMTKRTIKSFVLMIVVWFPRKILLPTFRNSIERNRCTFLGYLTGFLIFKYRNQQTL